MMPIPRNAKGLEMSLDSRHIALVALGILVLTITLAWQIALPVFRSPHRTGRYQIGTLTYHWVDPRRFEIFGADRHARRVLMVQIWYTAKGDASPPRAPLLLPKC